MTTTSKVRPVLLASASLGLLLLCLALAHLFPGSAADSIPVEGKAHAAEESLRRPELEAAQELRSPRPETSVAAESPGAEDEAVLAEPEVLVEADRGSLRLRVLREGVPSSEGLPFLLPRRSFFVPQGDLTAFEGARRLDWTSTGLALCDDLADGAYHALLQLDGGAVLRGNFDIEGGSQAEVIFGLEGASIEGIVFGPNGSPLEGARVQLDGAWGEHTGSVLWTEADGSYRFTGLTPGLFWMGVNHGGSFHSNAEHMLRVRIAAGEVKRQDFGDPSGLLVVRGRIFQAQGKPFEPSPAKGFKLCVLREGEKDFASTAVGSDGRFELRLQAGGYSAWMSLPHQIQVAHIAGKLQVIDPDAEVDLTLSRAILRGRVRRADGAAIEGKAYITVECHAEKQRDRRIWTSLQPDGTYELFDLSPGTWQVTSAAEKLGEPLPFEVLEGDGELHLDVVLPE